MSFVTLVLKKESGQQAYVDANHAVSQQAPENVKIMVDRSNPFKVAPTTEATGSEVKKLGVASTIPDARIQKLVTGSTQAFKAKIGFVDPDLKPTKPTIALWVQFLGNEYRTHEFVLGGPSLDIKFALSKMLGLTGKEEDVNVSITTDTSALRFRRGSSITSWKNIGTMFQGQMTLSKPVDLTTGPQILTRFVKKS